MKRFYVLIGNFGSGKSEISLNMAFSAAREHSAVLVDLDIVNPYFRSVERKKELEAANVKLLYPVFALSTVDVPSLPPDIYSVFVDEREIVVFDVGGDPTGATALGQYKANFEAIPPENLEVLFVVNPRRPFSATADLVLDMLEKVEFCARLPITGFINNGNLAAETTVEDLIEGYRVLKEVSEKTGKPVRYTTGVSEVLKGYLAHAKSEGFEAAYIGEPMEIEIHMHRDWDRFTQYGV